MINRVRTWFSTQPSLVAIVAVSFMGTSMLCGQVPPITDVAFSPDGKSVVTCSQIGLQILSWPELDLQTTVMASAANLHCLAFSPDGKQLAVGGGNPAEDGAVEVFTWPECKSLLELSGHDDSVTSVAWQDGTILVSASHDRTVKIWNLTSQEPIRALQGHSGGVSAACILSDGTVVTAGRDQSVRVWNAESGEPIRSLNQHTKPINGLALRPVTDGLPVVASSAEDRTIRFWQPTIGRMMRYVRLESEALAIAWLHDGKHLAAACVDGRIHIVDADEVKVTQTLPAIKGWAYAIAVHPSDRSVVVGGSDGQLLRVESPESRVESQKIESRSPANAND